MSSGDGKRRRVLSPEERVLWSAVTRTIAPMREAAPGEYEEEQGSATARRAAPAVRSVSIPQPIQEKKPLPPLTSLGRRAKQRVARGKEPIDGRLDLHGLTQRDRGTARKLERGHLAVEARLDLHGMRQREAHAVLRRFLKSAQGKGYRHVLVITGKGAGQSERGVLKRHVPHWLGLPEFREWVVGFEEAHIAHGGEGALYVRIRRNRVR